MGFSLPSIKCLAGPPSFRLLPNSVRCLNSAQRFDHRALGSSRKLGGDGEHLIDGSEKRICRLSFEFQSPHVIERRSKTATLLSLHAFIKIILSYSVAMFWCSSTLLLSISHQVAFLLYNPQTVHLLAPCSLLFHQLPKPFNCFNDQIQGHVK